MEGKLGTAVTGSGGSRRWKIPRMVGSKCLRTHARCHRFLLSQSRHRKIRRHPGFLAIDSNWASTSSFRRQSCSRLLDRSSQWARHSSNRYSARSARCSALATRNSRSEIKACDCFCVDTCTSASRRHSTSSSVREAADSSVCRSAWSVSKSRPRASPSSSIDVVKSRCMSAN